MLLLTQSNRIKLIGAAIVLLLLLCGLFVLVASRTETQHTFNLPEQERQQELDSGYLYASNRDLQDIMFELDIYLKQQGLTGDLDGEAFEFHNPETGMPLQKLDTCIEFKYFDNREHVLTVTLIPEDPSCFTEDSAVHDKIAELYVAAQFVYAATEVNKL